jgi:prepilin-type N-terminal cleavage/methylation domain-containing protein
MRPARPRQSPPGFTLVEMLVVLAVIAGMMGLVSIFLFKAKDEGERKIAGAEIQQIKAAISAYMNDPRRGAPPPTSLADEKVLLDNDFNLGIESLVVAFNALEYDSESPFTREDRYANGDKDLSKVQLTKFGKKDLFEYLDQWHRPFIYFRLSDFERGKSGVQNYQLPDGIMIEVQPVKSDALGTYAGMADGYQIISLGPDGEFGTKDDVVSWK